MPKDNSDIFAPLQAHILSSEYNDYDLFNIIAQAVELDPGMGRAMALHAKDVLWENHAEDITYTTVVAEVYRRTLYDGDMAEKYGTGDIAADRARLAQFTETLLALEQRNFSHADLAPSSTAAH